MRARIDDPEAFVWAILPHAARTFSACIALLPARSALPAAVAYLYCRMLDTYEDLVPDRREREASLRAFANRFADQSSANPGGLPPAPAIGEASDRDERDRAHLLLVRRASQVDRVFLSFDHRRAEWCATSFATWRRECAGPRDVRIAGWRSGR